MIYITDHFNLSMVKAETTLQRSIISEEELSNVIELADVDHIVQKFDDPDIREKAWKYIPDLIKVVSTKEDIEIQYSDPIFVINLINNSFVINKVIIIDEFDYNAIDDKFTLDELHSKVTKGRTVNDMGVVTEHSSFEIPIGHGLMLHYRVLEPGIDIMSIESPVLGSRIPIVTLKCNHLIKNHDIAKITILERNGLKYQEMDEFTIGARDPVCDETIRAMMKNSETPYWHSVVMALRDIAMNRAPFQVN